MSTRPFTILASSFLVVALLFASAPVASAKTSTSKGFPVTATAAKLRAAYDSKDGARILIMPGHEPAYGGAVYQGVYEREIVVDIANELAKELRQDPNIEVIVARDNQGWNSQLNRVFTKDMKKVQSFVTKQKKEMAKQVKSKKVKEVAAGTQVDHATAPTDVALRLYGINKWVNENDIDLVVNLHINDAPDHGPNTPGSNSGFSIYIPDKQFGNGAASRPVAQSIASRLNSLSATSTLRIENQGVAEDQQLIAVGANNSLKVPTVLIEYGYITESKFLEPSLRSTLARDYAYQTALGLRDFFQNPVAAKYPSKTLPRNWNSMPLPGSVGPDVYALQVALKVLGFYPPSESTLVSCPISGRMNECTQVALRMYQKSKSLPETGMLDAATREVLNARFGK